MPALVGNQFCQPCPVHHRACNYICLDCQGLHQEALCLHCRADHVSHRTLQVLKKATRDVVRVRDVASLIDISRVQQYVCNRYKVVHLKKWSGNKGSVSRAKPRYLMMPACARCRRRLKTSYNFCSIGCKHQVIATHTAQDTRLPKRTFKLEDAAESSCSLNKGAALPRTSRKGRPIRAPFY